MTREGYQGLAAGVLVALVIGYVARNTEWTEVRIPMPASGEARRNPFYASQRFAEALGARTAWDRAFSPPPSDAVVVLSSWHWTLSSRRREALERWVESGGRLVVDRLLLGDDEPFRRWSGIGRLYPDVPRDDPDDIAADGGDTVSPPGVPDLEEKREGTDPDLRACRVTVEERDGRASGQRYQLCEFDRASWLTTTGPAEWALRGTAGPSAVRVAVGRGSVTVVNGIPFRERELFRGDHVALFVAAAELRPGDEVRFLSEDDHPSLPALVWQHGGPAVVLLLALSIAMVWRQASRAGSLDAPSDLARRSLAEQIRGTGRFIVAHGTGEPLHAASVRALQEAMTRRVPGYMRLGVERQLSMLAAATGMDRETVAAAIHHAARRQAQELRYTLAQLEEARRRVLARTTHSDNEEAAE
jgi:hypothetical protein